MGRWVDGWMDGWTDEQINRLTEGQMDIYIYRERERETDRQTDREMHWIVHSPFQGILRNF
jgi:hypothetical protein